MKKNELKKVKLINASNIELTCRCCFAENGLKSALLYCSGFGGTYGELGNVFSDYAKEHGMTFLWGQFQDTYDIKDAKKQMPDGSFEKIKIGATYSSLDCAEEDYDCFFDYIKSLGVENLHIVATCVSCSKIVRYLLDGGDRSHLVKSLALCAPQDLKLINNRSKNSGLLEEARIYMSAGKPNELLSKKFLGYMPISAHSYMDICTNEKYNTLSYLTNESNLEQLSYLEIPILFLLAEKDGAVLKNATLNAQECVNLLSSKCRNAIGETIPEATHLFEGYESKVVEKLNKFYSLQKINFKDLGDKNVK